MSSAFRPSSSVHSDLPVGDRSDLAGITVDDAQPPVVAASDDPIADGERTAVGRELVVGRSARASAARPAQRRLRSATSRRRWVTIVSPLAALVRLQPVGDERSRAASAVDAATMRPCL